MDSFTPAGRHFTPMYGTSAGSSAFADQPWPLLSPDDTPMEWSIDYDPDAAGGLGEITVTLDGVVRTLTLQPGQKSEGAVLDHFGIFNMQKGNGKHANVFFDDLRYTFAASTDLLTAGDTDLDGDVDLSDLGNLATAYGVMTNATWDIGDFDSDGDVDLNDLGTLATNFEGGRAAALAQFSAIVPEPTSCAGLLALGWLLSGRRAAASKTTSNRGSKTSKARPAHGPNGL
jgi:hypothetical protein